MAWFVLFAISWMTMATMTEFPIVRTFHSWPLDIEEPCPVLPCCGKPLSSIWRCKTDAVTTNESMVNCGGESK